MMPSWATTGPKIFVSGHAFLMAVAYVVLRVTMSSKLTVPLVVEHHEDRCAAARVVDLEVVDEFVLVHGTGRARRAAGRTRCPGLAGAEVPARFARAVADEGGTVRVGGGKAQIARIHVQAIGVSAAAGRRSGAQIVDARVVAERRTHVVDDRRSHEIRDAERLRDGDREARLGARDVARERIATAVLSFPEAIVRAAVRIVVRPVPRGRRVSALAETRRPRGTGRTTIRTAARTIASGKDRTAVAMRSRATSRAPRRASRSPSRNRSASRIS